MSHQEQDSKQDASLDGLEIESNLVPIISAVPSSPSPAQQPAHHEEGIASFLFFVRTSSCDHNLNGYFSDFHDPSWALHRKHFFILSSSGRPIFSR